MSSLPYLLRLVGRIGTVSQELSQREPQQLKIWQAKPSARTAPAVARQTIISIPLQA